MRAAFRCVSGVLVGSAAVAQARGVWAPQAFDWQAASPREPVGLREGARRSEEPARRGSKADSRIRRARTLGTVDTRLRHRALGCRAG